MDDDLASPRLADAIALRYAVAVDTGRSLESRGFDCHTDANIIAVANSLGLYIITNNGDHFTWHRVGANSLGLLSVGKAKFKKLKGHVLAALDLGWKALYRRRTIVNAMEVRTVDRSGTATTYRR
ncbi:MAG: hypothetical protein HYX82_01035 [Chloroflexi bacterium]|nr:hypothetical protein [Chloroflexota bacterium]